MSDSRFNRAFVNDAQGNAVYVNQGAGTPGNLGGRIQNAPAGYLGGFIGDALSPGHIQRQLIVNGEVLARYGDAPTAEENTNPSNNPVFADTADFRLQAAQIRPRHESLDPVAYTVVGGETLKDIARNVLGDASLWWRIAEANSLAVSGDGKLTAGQTLQVPKLALNANNTDTFQPYDPSQATGSMDPVLPVPKNGGGCGGVGKIIMIVVAIVVTIYTAGAASALISGTASSLGGAMAAGSAALTGGGLAGVGAGAMAIGAAAGSIASQAVGIAIGAQDSFSWKSVALSAIGGGISGGMGNWAPLGEATTTGTAVGNAMIRATVGNIASQSIGVVTGLQSSFNWQSVAASAAGAGVGQAVGGAFGMNDADFGQRGFGEKFGARLFTGLAAGTAAALASGGRVAIQQVATDAFGQALGSSLAAASSSGSSYDQAARSSDPLGGFIEQNQGAWNQRQANYDQMVDVFSNPTVYGRDNDVLLAAGPGYSGMSSSSQRDENIARMLRLANQPEAMGSEVPFRVEVNGVGWTGANVLPDGTQVYRSTDPTNDLRMIEAANGAGTVPILNGYGFSGVRTYAGGADLLYSPGVTQDAANVYNSDSVSTSNPYSFNWNWIAGAGMGVPNLRQATPVPTNPILPVNNGRWTGVPGNSGWVSTNASVNAVTGGRPVQFNNGMVNFDPWSQGRINVPNMTGANSDLRLGRDALREQYGIPTDEAAKQWLRERKLTLHHNANGLSLGNLCTNHLAVCICGFGQSAALQILAIAPLWLRFAPCSPSRSAAPTFRSIRAELS